MLGSAKTNNFNLGTATVMIGPADKLFDLNAAEHSIGLVKNFSMSSEPQYTDLMQGVKNSLVYSVLTANAVRASMEVYEYTNKNLTYALGLDGTALDDTAVETAVTTEVDGSTTPATSITVDDGADITAGDHIMLDLGDDSIVVREVTASVTNELTISPEIAQVIPAGTPVRRVSAISVGSKEEQPYLGAKIVGKLANGKPIAILIPKIRVSNGFTLNFQTNDYGNLPYEFTVFDVLPGDPHYTSFKDEQAKVFAQ